MQSGTSPVLTPLAAVAAVVVLALAACEPATDPQARATDADRLDVYVVNYPLQYFAERLGGDRVAAHFPAPADVDPAYWTPDDEVIAAYQQADVILLNGAGYARWLRHVSLPEAAQVNTAEDIEDRLLEVPDAITHAHGPGEPVHTHAGTAFTTWLDPTLAIEQARAVKQAFSERLPDHADAFAERFEALAGDFEALDERLEQIVSEAPDLPLLASHPVYHYLEARYALNLESVHWEPDEMPDAGEWESLDGMLEKRPVRWMLWEDEPLQEIASGLAERGVEVIVYRPAAQPPEEGDLLSIMRENAENLGRAFAAGEGD